MKKKYLCIIIGIIFMVIFLTIIKKKESSKPQELPLLNTSGKNKIVKRIKTLTTNGGRVDWSSDGNLIAFDREGKDGYYDVWTMRPDGAEQKCLTCDNPNLPQKHNGQPAWHPSGDYIVFQSENPKLGGFKILPQGQMKLFANPGAGINNNLWMMDKNANQFWQLTDIDDKMAVLHPHFSHDGKKIFWSERINGQPGPVGQWAIKVADFVFADGRYSLANVQTLTPGQMRFYESHGFSLDDQSIIYSATKDGYYQNLDIFIFNLKDQTLQNLTDSFVGQWDEHAQLSPDGSKIIWMSSQDIPQTIKQNWVVTDYWLMNSDGSGKQRLTYFNDPTAPEYLGYEATAADSSWSPDSKRLVVYLIDKARKKGPIVLIELGK